MFKKVLIAEDFDSINIAVKQTLESPGRRRNSIRKIL